MSEPFYPSYSDPGNPSFQPIYATLDPNGGVIVSHQPPTPIDPNDGLPVPVEPTPNPNPAPAAGGLLDTLMGNDGTRILGFTPVVALAIAGAGLYFLNSKN